MSLCCISAQETKQTDKEQIRIDDFAVPFKNFLKDYAFNNKNEISKHKTVYEVKSLNKNDKTRYFVKVRTIGKNTNIEKIYMEHMINKSGISTKYINIYYDKDNNIYILMKLLDYTLGVYILTHRNKKILHKLNENNSQYIAQCIGNELLKLHKLGYVHCDIKPHNIMYDKNMNKWHLIDFDLSVSNNTIKKHYIGTCSWSSIEHLYDNKSNYLFTTKCDVFTFGLIIIYSLFGTHPFATFDANNINLLKNKYSKHPNKKYLQHCDLLKLYHPNYTHNAMDKMNEKIESYNMSKELTDLIQKMLVCDPKKRIGIQSVMNHSWFKVEF